MKKLIWSLFTITLFISCSSDDENEVEENKFEGAIKASYVTHDIGWIDDVCIYNDEVYGLSTYHIQESDLYEQHLWKIDTTGKKAILNKFDYLSNFMGITTSNAGDLYWVTGNGEVDGLEREPDKFGNIFWANNNNFENVNSYPIKKVSSPFINREHRLDKIENYGDDTYVVYDYGVNSLKRYLPDVNTDYVIAGGIDRDTIIDGIGESASFEYVRKIVVGDKYLYIIDNDHAIRRIKKEHNNYEVKTLVSNYPDEISDIALDSDNNLYVFIYSEGIYKMDIDSGALTLFASGDRDIIVKGENTLSATSFMHIIDGIEIYKEDMYFNDGTSIYKVPNFKKQLISK